jgi:hypothetical protein
LEGGTEVTDRISTGQCLCGDIRFEAAGDPIWVSHCHCRSCRRNTGAAVATFVGFRRNQVTYTAGERRIFESSPGVRRGFCAHCGTPLTYEGDRFPAEIHLYLGTLDEPERFVAESHVHYEERVPWFDIADDLPRRHGSSAGNIVG